MSGRYVFQGSILPNRANMDISDEVKTSITRGQHQGEVTIHFEGADIIVEFDLEGDLVNILTFRNLVRNIVDSVVTPVCYLTGTNLSFELSSVRAPNEKTHTFGVSVPEVDGLDDPDSLFGELSRIMSLYDGDGGNYLRSSLRDYYLAMDSPLDTGFYCYRAIESLRQNFQTEGMSSGDAWPVLRDRLGIDKSDIMTVKELADDRRHGDIIDVPGQDREEILNLTWDMIMKYVDYLDRPSDSAS